MEVKLSEACFEKRLEEAKEILTKNPNMNVNWKDEDGEFTCFHWTCRDNHSSLVPLLLARPDINVNQKNANGWTPFYLASRNGHTAVVQLMLKDARVLINEPQNSGYTPLSLAARDGHMEVIKCMIASGRDLDLGQKGKNSDAIGEAKKKPKIASLLEKFKTNRTKTITEIRKELGINVVSSLESFLGISLPICATTVPEIFTDPSQVSFLSLADCHFSALPDKLASFTSLTELTLNYNRLTSLPPWTSSPLSSCLQNVKKLNLCGVETIDFVALSTWLNGSAVTDLDLSDIKTLWNSSNQLALFIKSTKGVKKLRLFDCPTTGEGEYDTDEVKALKTAAPSKNSKFALSIIQSLLSHGVNSFETIVIDYYVDLLKEDSSQLTSLPAEIREKSAQEIIKYVIDLKKSESVSLYRTKLMVVGYEKVGKTSLLECLFPLKTTHPVIVTTTTKGTQQQREQALVEVTGQKELILRSLAQTTSAPQQSSAPSFFAGIKTVFEGKATQQPSTSSLPPIASSLKMNLGDGQWTVTSSSSSLSLSSSVGNATQIELKRKQQHQPPSASLNDVSQITLSATDASESAELLKRLKRICGDDRTHGIEIQKQLIPIPSSSSSSSLSSTNPPAQLEVSVWDFGGQHEYYNNHHYFLSARSVFLVVWKVTENINDLLGIGGLEFWLRSLKAHLPPPPPAPTTTKPSYSIIVVGTHVDALVDHEKTVPLRQIKVQELFNRVFESHPLPFDYIEISSKTGYNMAPLHTKIVSTSLGHSYMGELIPKSYLAVEDEIMRMKKEKYEAKSLPLVDFEGEFLFTIAVKHGLKDAEEAKRALGLLHLGGQCVHFGDSPVLSQFVVLDPSWLTQSVMSTIFHYEHAEVFRDGIIHHKVLKWIWSESISSKAEMLMAMMQKFEVCFDLQDADEKGNPLPFWNRHSVITAYLPLRPPKASFNSTVWPEECPSRVLQLKRVYSFNIIPQELVSRLLVCLHGKMEEKAIWRNGLYLESADSLVKTLMRANTEKNTLEAIVRGGEIGVSRLIMNTIVKQLEAVIKNYAGITTTFKENVVNSGLEGKKWWEFNPTSAWEKKGDSEDGSSGGGIHSLLIYKDGVDKDGELVGKLKAALWSLGGNFDDVVEAFSLHNAASTKMFDGFRDNLLAKQIKTPSLFAKTTWKDMSDSPAREDMIEEHEKHLSRFDWNEQEKLKISLMVQGTPSEAAWGIAQGGFGVIASEGDQGWFGKGIYMTSSLKYAHSYTLMKSAVSPTILICVTVPGNVFPVIDMSRNGLPGIDGYQSHFTMVDFERFPNCKPILNFKGKPNVVDELVCFQESQTLPLFIMKLKNQPSFAPMIVKPPFNLPKPKELSTPSSPAPASNGSVEMSRGDFETLSSDDLVKYLVSKGVDLEDEDLEIFKKQRISGRTICKLTKEDLIGVGIPLGLAADIVSFIPK